MFVCHFYWILLPEENRRIFAQTTTVSYTNSDKHSRDQVTLHLWSCHYEERESLAQLIVRIIRLRIASPLQIQNVHEMIDLHQPSGPFRVENSFRIAATKPSQFLD